MTGAEIALIITALATLGGLFVNARKIEEVNAANKAIESENEELQIEIDRNRKDIISLGEHYASMSKDVGVLIVLVNKLYTDYEKDTGKKPDIDWGVLDKALTIQHKTSPLGPLQIR